MTHPATAISELIVVTTTNYKLSSSVLPLKGPCLSFSPRAVAGLIKGDGPEFQQTSSRGTRAELE